MKPHKISFVNAVTLISFGLWGYIDVDYSPTALIPVVFGVIILALDSIKAGLGVDSPKWLKM